jgi:hypothetical protein
MVSFNKRVAEAEPSSPKDYVDSQLDSALQESKVSLIHSLQDVNDMAVAHPDVSQFVGRENFEEVGADDSKPMQPTVMQYPFNTRNENLPS